MRVYSGEKPYFLSKCTKSFVISGNSQVHMRFHTFDNPTAASFAPSPFLKTNNFRVHMKVQTSESYTHFYWLSFPFFLSLLSCPVLPVSSHMSILYLCLLSVCPAHHLLQVSYYLDFLHFGLSLVLSFISDMFCLIS